MSSDFMFLVSGLLFCLFYALNKIIEVNSDPKEEKIDSVHKMWEHLDGGAMFFGFLFSPIATPIMGFIFLFNFTFSIIFKIKKEKDSSLWMSKEEITKQREAIKRRVNKRLGID